MKKILQDEKGFKKDAIDGMSLVDLAKKYNMEPCTVSIWKRKLNVLTVPKNIPLPDKITFANEVKKYTNVQLAERYNVGLRLISKWRIKLGLTNIWPEQIVDWEQFERDSNCLRLRELMDKYDVALSTIKRWKQIHGLSAKSHKKENRKITFVKVGNINDCWACTSHVINNKGYPSCKGDQLVVKRLWEEKYNKEWPLDLVCIHSCDNPWCINPEHISPGTMKENQEGMAERHRSCWGWRNGIRKLTPEQAKEIYALKGTTSLRKAAKKFNVSSANVFSIWKGNTWWRDIIDTPNFPKKLNEVKSGEELERTVIGSPEVK